jgi:hypothetical protein
VDVEVDSLHVKRIDIDDLVGYVYIVRVDIYENRPIFMKTDKTDPDRFCWFIKN